MSESDHDGSGPDQDTRRLEQDFQQESLRLCPKKMKMEGNLATNWKKFRRGWENYAIVSQLDKVDERFNTALFLSVIGEDAMEVFEGMHFTASDNRYEPETVVKKFEMVFIGETNETYERFVFNNRNQKEGETI